MKEARVVGHDVRVQGLVAEITDPPPVLSLGDAVEDCVVQRHLAHGAQVQQLHTAVDAAARHEDIPTPRVIGPARIRRERSAKLAELDDGRLLPRALGL